MYDTANTIARMKCCTRARVIFHCTMIVAMLNFLELRFNSLLIARQIRKQIKRDLPYASREDIHLAKYVFVECLELTVA